MTEDSLPWGGAALGDAGPYSDDVWSDTWRKLFIRDRTEEGVLVDYLNELAVSGAVSPVTVETGGALNDGKFYDNDAAVTVAVPTPAALTRIDRIVVRKDFVNQTVRIARIAGVEGGAAPALVQVDGTTWDIPLAQASIAVGGVITLTDERNFLGTPMARLFAPGADTLTIDTGVITVDGKSHYLVDTEAAAASDDLDTINGGFTGQIIILRAANAARTVIIQDGTGNIVTANSLDVTLDDGDQGIQLRFDGSNWIQIAHADIRALELLASTSVSIAAASVTFSSIPAHFASLLVLIYARGDNATTQIILQAQLNADAGANYDKLLVELASGGLVTAEGVAQTELDVLRSPGATAPANSFGAGQFRINNYANTSNHKMTFALGGIERAASAGNIIVSLSSGRWLDTAVVTSITFFGAAGNIDAGSRFELYGVR